MSVTSSSRPKIVVLGSINMDLVARCNELPSAGQTLLANSFAEISGGKGANQSVAASRAGGDVRMIGRVGDDGFGSQLLANLLKEQIDCTSVQQTADSPSGLAMIAVAESGENQILVVPGANGLVTPDDVDCFSEKIINCDALLLQLEVPIAAVLHAIDIAATADVHVILDPAPAPTDFPPSLLNVDLVCPNETEAAAITGCDTSSREGVETAARKLHQMGAKAVVITLGDRGALLFDGSTIKTVDPIAVEAVDSTAAGDAFVGALAVRWVETGSLERAVQWGNAAGAFSATRPGAQPSIALRDELEDFKLRKWGSDR